MTRAHHQEVVLLKPDALYGDTSSVIPARAADLIKLLRAGLYGQPSLGAADVRYEHSRTAAELAQQRIAKHDASHAWFDLDFGNTDRVIANLAAVATEYDTAPDQLHVRQICLDVCCALGFEISGRAEFTMTEFRFGKIYRPSDMKVPRHWLAEYFLDNTCEVITLRPVGGTNTHLQVAKEYVRGVLQAGTTEYLPTVLREADPQSRRLSNYIHVCDPEAHESDYLAALATGAS